MHCGRKNLPPTKFTRVTHSVYSDRTFHTYNCFCQRYSNWRCKEALLRQVLLLATYFPDEEVSQPSLIVAGFNSGNILTIPSNSTLTRRLKWFKKLSLSLSQEQLTMGMKYGPLIYYGQVMAQHIINKYNKNIPSPLLACLFKLWSQISSAWKKSYRKLVKMPKINQGIMRQTLPVQLSTGAAYGDRQICHCIGECWEEYYLLNCTLQAIIVLQQKLTIEER